MDGARPASGSATNRRIGLYFGFLALTSGLADPTGLVSIPVLFLLKDQLLLGPQRVAVFEALTMVPHYLAVVFGILRDRWTPFGRGDRGYLVLAAPLVVACYLWLAAVPVSFGGLLVGIAAAMIAFQVIDAATQSLMTEVGQRRLMTGRLSALSEIMESAVGAMAMLLGGWLVVHRPGRAVFLAAAAVAALLFAQGFWRPSAIYGASDAERITPAGVGHTLRSLGRDRGFRLTALALVLYNFSPGWGTPLLYYLTDQAGISATAFGAVRAASFVSMAVVTLLYGVLCVRYPLQSLLRWSVLLNILPGFLFLAIGSPAQAVAVSTLIGLLGGFANIALFDLLMRASPSRLEGTAGMLGVSAFGVAGAIGDLAGAWLYSAGGFVVCLALDAVATAFMLPVILRLPAGLVAPRDGESLGHDGPGPRSAEVP